ncbi:MAG: hypothetical protein ACRDVG_15535, partial [Jatrophihabitantaceae bacterium]
EDEDFVLTIVDVFTLTGRGTAVIGPIESGVLRTGDEVEIWDDHQLVSSARATVEGIYSRHADPRSIGLLLGEVDKNLLAPGQTVRRKAATK